MKKSLTLVQNKLTAMIARASDLYDSDNEDIADKYSEVCELLEAASESVETALMILEA